jgi:hypothetical protein
MALAGLFAVGCGHEQVTGSAKNDWATPTGYATATHPEYVNPMAVGLHARANRNFFANQEGQPPPPTAGSAIEQPAPPPPMDAAPDVVTPDTTPGPVAPPPYVMPPP